MNPGLAAIYLALALLALAAWAGYRSRRRLAPVPVPVARPHALYHIPGTGRCPLRIGITVNPAAREEQYKREAWWYPQRTGPLTVRRWYPDELSARAAERAAIRAEAPTYNIQHNLGRGHVLAARRMELRHVPDTRTEPDPLGLGPARVQLRRVVTRRRVRPDGVHPTSRAG